MATGDGGVTAIAVTERVEPHVIGSELHRLAYPDRYAEHLEREGKLDKHEHHGSSLQLRYGIQT